MGVLLLLSEKGRFGLGSMATTSMQRASAIDFPLAWQPTQAPQRPALRSDLDRLTLSAPSTRPRLEHARRRGVAVRQRPAGSNSH